MCSGCSGHFEDEEEQDQGDGGPDERDLEAFWRPEGDLHLSQQPPARRAGMPAPDVEGYEVLVSAERIIERSTIRANACVHNVLGDPDFAQRYKRSQPESANTYRTFRPFEPDFDFIFHSCGNALMWRCLAIAAAAALLLSLVTR
jgi:hypothetical protein